MKLTDNCYAVTGLYYIPPWSVNAGFIAGKKKTLIVDTGGSSISAQTINGYASSVKPDNEIIVINTEKHLDHIGGNGFFADKGNLIFGHESIDRSQNELISSISEFNCLIPNAVRRNANEAAIAFKNTKIVNPDHKFDQAFDMDLGGIQVHIIMTPGHTKSNISVYAQKVLYCGDCVIPELLPNLEEGKVAEWQKWINSLETIELLNFEYLVPGHGFVVSGKSDIHSTISRMKNILGDAIRSGKAPTTEL